MILDLSMYLGVFYSMSVCGLSNDRDCDFCLWLGLVLI